MGVEERVSTLAKRSIKTDAKQQGIRLAISMLDLTTLEGADTPGKVRQLAAKAVQAGFGVAPVFMREGGTVPVGTLFKQTLGIDTLFIGFGLSDDRVHSPNEKFDLDALHKGTRTAAALYAELANLPPQK